MSFYRPKKFKEKSKEGISDENILKNIEEEKIPEKLHPYVEKLFKENKVFLKFPVDPT